MGAGLLIGALLARLQRFRGHAWCPRHERSAPLAPDIQSQQTMALDCSPTNLVLLEDQSE
jgi:hypothetical protein